MRGMSYNPVAPPPLPVSMTYAIAQNWFAENVNKNLSASQLFCFPGATFGVKQWIAPRNGSVTGFYINMDHVAAGSTPTLAVYKNGLVLLSEVVSLGASHKESVYLPLLHPFSIGDVLDVRVTTDANWTATNADVLVTVEVTM